MAQDPNSIAAASDDYAHPNGQGTTSPEENPAKGPEALADLANKVADLSEYLSVYLGSHVDQFKLSMREFIIGISGIPLMILFLGSAVLIAWGFLFFGIAMGLREIFAGKAWLAFLITGAFFLISLSGIMGIYLNRVKARSFKKKLKAYEKEFHPQK